MGKKKILLYLILVGMMTFFVSCGKESNGFFTDVIPGKDKMVTLLEYQREASVSYTMSDSEAVDKFLEQIYRLSVEPAKEWTNELVTLPIYGIAVMQKPEGEALEAHITYGYWSNGYWVDADGQAYKMKLPVEKLKTNYAWEEEKPFSSITTLGVVGPLVLDEKGWKKELLTEAKSAATIPGLVTTATKEGDTLTVSIDNQGESAYMGDKYDYVLEVCLDEVWYELPLAVWGRFERGDVPWFNPGVKSTLTYSLSIYDSLPEGTYRLVTGSGERRESLVEFVLDATAIKQPETLYPTATPAPTVPPTPTDIPETVMLPIDAAHFGSTVFCEFIAKEYDCNSDGYLSEAERCAVTNITIPGRYEADYSEECLDGFEFFSNLEILNIDCNAVKKVVIRNHPTLKLFGGTEGYIKKLEIIGCKELESIGFYMYNLGSVLIAETSAETEFSLGSNVAIESMALDEDLQIHKTDLRDGDQVLFRTLEDGTFVYEYWKGGSIEEYVLKQIPVTILREETGTSD